MPRPKRTSHSMDEWKAIAKERPVVNELLRVGDELRSATARREALLAEEKRVIAARRTQALNFQAKAEAARVAVMAAADSGLTTADIAEVLGINEAWVTRIRTAGPGPYTGKPSAGPKMLRPPPKDA